MADYDENARSGVRIEYNVANPHPMHGKDPNILNEFGHTVYPKYIDHPSEKNKNGFPVRVVVKNEEEEKKLLGDKFIDNTKKEDKKDWSK